MFVYLLRSIKDPSRTYTGSTDDVPKRLTEHNNGKSGYTSRYARWHLEAYIWMPDRYQAFRLEKYLKSGSGRAFQEKHLRPTE
jgi:putative endonuclease